MVAIEYLTLPEEVLLLRAFDAKANFVRKEADNHLVYLVAGLVELLLRGRIGLDPRRQLIAQREQPDDWPERQPLISIERSIRQLFPLSLEEALEVLTHENLLAAEMVAQGLEFKGVLHVTERRRLGLFKEPHWQLINPQVIEMLQQRIWNAANSADWPDLRCLGVCFLGYSGAHFGPARQAVVSQAFRRWHQKAQEIVAMASGRGLDPEERQVAALMTCLDAMDRWRTRQPLDRLGTRIDHD
ncbi:MAG: GPP34 family phosphoprotein [Verrucomicrobiota bacterium JB022]|nr:GPP34 family phosphoprotein [Verrucomicrobiota bacterium JB022]